MSKATDQQRELVKQREERFKEYLADRQIWIDRRAESSQARAKKNVEMAQEVRDRWLASFAK